VTIAGMMFYVLAVVTPHATAFASSYSRFKISLHSDPLAVYASKLVQPNHVQVNLNDNDAFDFSLIFAYEGILLFCIGSYKQYESHVILAKLRGKEVDTVKHHYQQFHPDLTPRHQYYIPFGGWFTYCSSPHYFCEILIYCSFAFISSFDLVQCLCLVWVAMNLFITADATHQWYQRKFAEEYPRHRTRLIPFLY
jgi:hypothetical protein